MSGPSEPSAAPLKASPMPGRDECARLDQLDPLATLRGRFVLDDQVIYLDGNSLGPLPVGVVDAVRRVIVEEWGSGLIRSWNDAGWIEAPQRIGARLAPLLGAGPDEVIVCDSISLNIVKLTHAALTLRADRHLIVTEEDGFPTDRYLLAQAAADRGATLTTVAPERLTAWLADREQGRATALVVLGHVDYRSGRRHDLAALTAAVHRAGALVLFDVAHSVGLLPLQLDRSAVDFAVGCGYKYLSGGPGAPGFAFVARRWHRQLVHPLVGWMGHRRPFEFAATYEPAEDLRRLLVGTPPILALAALEAALATFDGVSLEALWRRNGALVELALVGLDSLTERHPELQVVTPRQPEERGGHLAVRHPQAGPLSSALIEAGVIGDFRPPDVLRWAFPPLYLRRVDVYDAVSRLAVVLDERRWDAPRHRRSRIVT